MWMPYYSPIFICLNIVSVVLSSINVAVVAVMLVMRREDALKPSFRLSASIAAVNTVHHTCMLISEFVSPHHHLSTAGIRMWLWADAFSYLSYMFLVGCISLQLQLTIVHNKPHVASLANPYYEVVGILVPLLMTHAFTYAFGIQWEPHYFAFTSSNPRGLYLYDWLAIYGWLSALWLYCLVVCVMVIGKLLVLWRKTTRPHMLLLPPGPDQIKPSPGHSSETLLHGSEQWVWPGAPLSARRCSRPSETSSSATTVASVRRKTGNDCQLRRLRFTILRVLLYPLTTVLIGLCPVFLTLVPDSRPLALFFLTFVSCQGTLSFVCFVCNPGTSQFAKIIAARLSGIQGSQ